MIKNSIWSFIGTIGVQIINLGGNIILARLLYPELFGLLGLTTMISGFILIIQEAGFSTYIIYRRKINKRIVSTSFWINFILSCILSLFFYSISSRIAAFFNEKALINIISLLSLGLIFAALGITSRALLMREKKFSILAAVDLIAQLVSTIIAILFAINQYYYFAITTRFLFSPIIQSALLLTINFKKVIGKADWSSFREIVPYSSKILSTNIILFFNNNLDYFMIGKFLGSRQLGLYTIAYQWSVIARYYIAGSINKVLLPELSSKNNDLNGVTKIFLNVTDTVSFITFPFCFGLVAISNDFIILLYGQSWMNAVTVLQILLIAGAITSVGTLSGSLFQGLGKPKIELIFNIVSFIFNILFIYTGTRFGLISVSLGILFVTLFMEIVKVFIIKNLLNITLTSYLHCFLPNLLSAIGMLSGVILLNHYIFVNINIYIRIIVEIFVGIVLFMLISTKMNRDKLKETYNFCTKKIIKI